jgi:hypothetical protein
VGPDFGLSPQKSKSFMHFLMRIGMLRLNNKVHCSVFFADLAILSRNFQEILSKSKIFFLELGSMVVQSNLYQKFYANVIF